MSAHTLILGAGPGGLASALQLVREGATPILIEKDSEVGGLMRAVRRGPFVVDIGRKELYSRIPAVHRIWCELLGEDYRPYRRRVGILSEGRVFDASPRTLWAGMPRTALAAAVFDYFAYRFRSFHQPARSYQDYWYQRRGPRFTRMTTQTFTEKFTGRRWAELPPPPEASRVHAGASLRGMLRRKPPSQTEWRHPAFGTGQLCETIERRVRAAGGWIHLNAHITDIATAGDRITSVTAEYQTGARVTYEPVHVVSSLPVQVLARALSRDGSGASVTARRRASASTVLVYLFAEEAPRTPYTWIEVNCPQMQAGRITNYAAFNGAMVPRGKTCLCVEFFHADATGLLSSEDHDLRQLALDECAAAGLMTPERCTDHLVLKLPQVDAAARWESWNDEATEHARSVAARVTNLYDVSRPGTDRAFHAGMQAAEAILSGERAEFDRSTDPSLPSPWA
jgi:protoporphyrinogen oxidase